MQQKTTNNHSRLPTLNRVPELAELKNLLQLSQTYAGESIELPWEIDGALYVLSALVPGVPSQKGIINRKTSTFGETKWTLTTHASLTALPEVAWTHSSPDLELIENLLALIPRGSGVEVQHPLTASAAPAYAPNFFAASAAPAQSAHPNAAGAASAQSPNPFSAGAANPSAQPQQAQQSKLADSSGGMNLSGDLSEVDLNGVLQSIALLRMTGCLEMHRSLDEVFLFFEDGALLHALHESTLGSATATTGERIVLEIMLWEDGQFSFRHGKKCPDRTVSRALTDLLQESSVLKNYWKQLQAHSVDMEVAVLRTRSDMTKEQFEQTISQGLRIDPSLQQSIYLEINGKKSLYDIVSVKFAMPRTIWIPHIYNLLNLGLIKFGAKQSTTELAVNKPLIDQMKVEKARSSLVRIESGMLSYELFLHFLQLEFERTKVFPGHIFSVVVFSIHDQRTKEPLSVLSVGKLTETIEESTSRLNFLGHFRDHDFIILCPHQNEEQAAHLVERITNTLKKIQLDGLQADNLKLAFGVASFPQCDQILNLLTVAEAAKDRAMTSGTLVALNK